MTLSVACAPARQPPADLLADDTPAAAEPAPPSPTIGATSVRSRLVLPGLRGLACDAAGHCVVQLGQDIITLDLDPLGRGAVLAELADDERLVSWHGAAVLGACATGPGRCLHPLQDIAHAADAADDDAAADDDDDNDDATDDDAPVEAPLVEVEERRSVTEQRARWNEAIARQERSAFAARVPSPTGGSLAWLAHPDPRVMATGPRVRFMLLARDDAHDGPAVRYLRSLALHPTGAEAYLIAWPDGDLVAFDPQRLSARWTIPLQHAAHGLFVEGEGRLLLLEEGGRPDPDQLLDLGSDEPPLPADAAAASDLFLALADRPDARTTAVVDLALPKLVWREAGRYLGLVTLPGGDRLLATDQALVRLSVPDGPVADAPPPAGGD